MESTRTISSPLTVVFWDEFKENPWTLYELFAAPKAGSFTPNFDSSRVVYLNKTTEDKEPRVFFADTEDKLLHVKEEFLSKALVWFTTICHKRSKACHCAKISTAQFAVLLNAGHPSVAEPLTKAIDQALECISKDKKYCIEVDIGPSLEKWYLDKIQGGGCCSKTRTSKTRIYVTNCSKYEHLFDCGCLWCLCLCCCLLCAPCYKCHRCCKVKDINLSMGQLPISLRMSPAYRGRKAHRFNIIPDGTVMVTPPKSLAGTKQGEGKSASESKAAAKAVEKPTATKIIVGHR